MSEHLVATLSQTSPESTSTQQRARGEHTLSSAPLQQIQCSVTDLHRLLHRLLAVVGLVEGAWESEHMPR